MDRLYEYFKRLKDMTDRKKNEDYRYDKKKINKELCRRTSRVDGE